MTLFRFEAEQLVPASLEEVGDFFATSANLLKVMPPDMELQLLPPVPDKVEEGLIMPCRVKLFPGWHAQWVTKFTRIPLSLSSSTNSASVPTVSSTAGIRSLRGTRGHS